MARRQRTFMEVLNIGRGLKGFYARPTLLRLPRTKTLKRIMTPPKTKPTPLGKLMNPLKVIPPPSVSKTKTNPFLAMTEAFKGFVPR